MNQYKFPSTFVWGAATASYQIEGAADSRGQSVWDVFAHTPDKVFQGHTGDDACDHYHRYADDVRLMKQMGLQGYRFSIAWPRVLPEGIGQANDAGLDFYDRLIDTLLENGIAPYATLFHWDLPIPLYQRGGWLNRDSADWFSDYASLVVGRLGDRVKHWMTFNEPSVFTSLGYQTGTHAPGDRLSRIHLLHTVHHVLLAHGRAVQAIRAASGQPCQVGLAAGLSVVLPESPGDVDAARQITLFDTPLDNFWCNAIWLDPIVHQRYPDEALKNYANALPAGYADDLPIIGQPLDFLGLNVYFGQSVRTDADGRGEIIPAVAGQPATQLGWPITPSALYWGPRFIYERYQLPIYITENGLSNMDWVALDGKVYDPQRIDFTTRYLRELARAAEDGADIRGYFHWSLLDNFEWAEGYKQRFGLIHVDFASQKRTLKESAYWYSEVIRTNGRSLY